MSKYPVLMYHRIVSDRCLVPRGDREEARYAVSIDEFVRQLDRMCELGLTGVSMRQIDDRLGGPAGVPAGWVALTFDDGNASDYMHATPLLAERGFRATFFVCGCRVDADGGLERGMIRAMVDAGMHIGAHGMTHRLLTALDAGAEQDEVVRSRDLLAGITAQAVDHFAPPGGRFSRRTLVTLKRAGFRAVCTSELGYNDRTVRPATFKRIPVTRAVQPSRFDAIVCGDSVRLVGMFARARALVLTRRILGESAYRRARAMGIGR